jgi:hypothetical protein
MELQKIGDLTVPAELEIREDKVFLSRLWSVGICVES